MLVEGLQHHGGPGGHRRRLADLRHEGLELARRAHAHEEHVRGIAGHGVARLDRRDGLEELGGVVGLARVQRADLDERGERPAHGLGVEQRTVAPDHARALEPAQARLHRGGRQADPLGELGERGARVMGDGGREPRVDRVVHAPHAISRPRPPG